MSSVDMTSHRGSLTQCVRGLWRRAFPANPDRLYKSWVRARTPSRGAIRAQRQWSARENTIVQPHHLRGGAGRLESPPNRSECSRPELSSRGNGSSSRPKTRYRISGVLSRESGPSNEYESSALRQEAHARERGTVGCTRHAGNSRRCSASTICWRHPRSTKSPVPSSDRPSGICCTLTKIASRATICRGSSRISSRTGRPISCSRPTTSAGWPCVESAPPPTWVVFASLWVRQKSGISFCVCRARPHGSAVCPVVSTIETKRTVPEAGDRAQAVLHDHCEALGLQVAVTTSGGLSRVAWDVQGKPTVSIIIPNRNAFAVLSKAVDGLCHHTSYPRRELVIVDNGSTEREVLDLYHALESDGSGRIVPFARPFNFSAACNAGAAAAHGDLLLFLNNDIEVIQSDWLEELIRWAERPEVGIVGAKLLYPDRTIQHGGVVFGLGLVGHIFGRAAEGESGVFGSSESYRNYVAVTGACQMMRKNVFQQLGGYDERFRLSFSDVVLCMEAWKAGLRVVYTPYARLVHHESYTRKREDSPEDMELLARYLRTTRFVEDPYLHPELNAKSLIPVVGPPSDPGPRRWCATTSSACLPEAAGEGPRRSGRGLTRLAGEPSLHAMKLEDTAQGASQEMEPRPGAHCCRSAGASPAAPASCDRWSGLASEAFVQDLERVFPWELERQIPLEDDCRAEYPRGPRSVVCCVAGPLVVNRSRRLSSSCLRLVTSCGPRSRCPSACLTCRHSGRHDIRGRSESAILEARYANVDCTTRMGVKPRRAFGFWRQSASSPSFPRGSDNDSDEC